MLYLYSFVGHLLSLSFRLIALFDKSVRKIVRGRIHTIDTIRRNIKPDKNTFLFHVSSLGEFEQGRPVIDRVRKMYPDGQVVISFFSPSGYEVCKNIDIADAVVYLPSDNISSVRKFLTAVNPYMVFFIKYDIWPVLLYELKYRNIPVFLVSAIFRKEQLFFKSYGKWYLNVLKCFTKIFVQNENSRKLLMDKGFDNVIVSGDTRFDRVVEISSSPKEIEEIKRMITPECKLLVVGSSWREDEDIFMDYFNNNKDLRLVIAPHKIDTDHISYIKDRCNRSIALISQVRQDDCKNYDCLVIDRFGLLSSIYHYADIVYIGGGFGKGIHNTIEAAVYGKPIIFGPNNNKFREAQDLKRVYAAVEINDKTEFNTIMDKLMHDFQMRIEMSLKSKNYVYKESGVVDRIFENIL